MDHDYGTCAPGATVMADLADPMVRLAPPAWHGLDVAQVLRGQTGSLNRPALNMGDLGTSEKFILARLVNEHVVVDGAA